jgi:FtsP/CotA-like multicopper oxidase with cupredoxin domain
MTTSNDPQRLGGAKKFKTVFVSGKKYRIQLINVAIEGHFQFSIDGYNLTVIANDSVTLVAYQTDSIVIGKGQRYDIIVEANVEVGIIGFEQGDKQLVLLFKTLRILHASLLTVTALTSH